MSTFRWDYIFNGDNEPGGRNHQLIDYVDVNGTMKYIWTLMKESTSSVVTPYDDDGESSTGGVDFIYIGFENGMFLGYKGPSPIEYVYMLNGNSSCMNITQRCRKSYAGNSTNQITGLIQGKPTLYIEYDPRYRPWYIQSKDSITGDIWTGE